MMDNSNEELLITTRITRHNFANQIITKVSYNDDLLIITNYVS